MGFALSSERVSIPIRYIRHIAILSVGIGIVAMVRHHTASSPQVGALKPLLLWADPTGPTRSGVRVAFSCDGRYLASHTSNGDVCLWEPRTGRLIRTIRVPAQASSRISFSPDSKYLALPGRQSLVLDVDTGRARGDLRLGYASCLVFSSDGRLIAGGGDRITVWDWSSGRAVYSLGQPDGVHESVAFSPTEGLLAYEDSYRLPGGKYVHQTRIWDTGRRKVVRTLSGAVGPYAFSPDGCALAARVAGRPGIRTWDTHTGRQLATLVDWRRIGCPLDVGFSPDGKYIAVSGSAESRSRWLPLYHRLLGQHPPDGVAGGAVTLSDAGAGTILWKETIGHSGGIFSVDISPDGELVGAASSWHAGAIVWRIH